jgi:hypothetical protein
MKPARQRRPRLLDRAELPRAAHRHPVAAHPASQTREGGGPSGCVWSPTTVGDARFAEPIDTAMVEQLARHHVVLITIEEAAIGGFSAMQHLAWKGLLDDGLSIEMTRKTVPQSFRVSLLSLKAGPRAPDCGPSPRCSSWTRLTRCSAMRSNTWRK